MIKTKIFFIRKQHSWKTCFNSVICLYTVVCFLWLIQPFSAYFPIARRVDRYVRLVCAMFATYQSYVNAVSWLINCSPNGTESLSESWNTHLSNFLKSKYKNNRPLNTAERVVCKMVAILSSPEWVTHSYGTSSWIRIYRYITTEYVTTLYPGLPTKLFGWHYTGNA